jgi:hypothetical protein
VSSKSASSKAAVRPEVVQALTGKVGSLVQQLASSTPRLTTMDVKSSVILQQVASLSPASVPSKVQQQKAQLLSAWQQELRLVSSLKR